MSASEAQSGLAAPKSNWSQFVDSFRRFLETPLNRFSFALTVLLFLTALVGPWLASYPFDKIDLINTLQAPSWEHLMGTDDLGRDVLARTLFGARISLSMAVLTIAFGLAVGIVLGATAGYAGGIIDEIIMRIVEIFSSIPGLIMAMALVAVLGPSPFFIVIALSVRRITQFARVTRGSVLSVKTQDYVTAGRVIGMGHARILFLHVLPNCMGPIVVLSTVLMGNVIQLESTLSFLGLGIQEPTPSWGTMIAKGNEYLRFAPWTSLFPGLFLLLTMIAFNLLGDGVRDHIDPRQGSVF